MIDTKPSNPKDAIGSKKLDFGLVPVTFIISAAKAFLEGALKYGRYNWRIAGVRSSIYYAALLRHVFKWWNGQNLDKLTRVHHLDNAIACLAIIRDAELYGKLTDDRPPCPNPDAVADMIDEAGDGIAHMFSLFGDHNPKQYTIADTPVRKPVVFDESSGCGMATGGTGNDDINPLSSMTNFRNQLAADIMNSDFTDTVVLELDPSNRPRDFYADKMGL